MTVIQRIVALLMSIGFISIVITHYLGHKQIGVDIFFSIFFIVAYSIIFISITTKNNPSGLKISMLGLGVMFLRFLGEFMFGDNVFGIYFYYVGIVIFVIGVVISMFQIGQRRQW